MSTKAYPRNRRIAEQIQRTLSELMRREIKDPRLGPVTITEVRVSKDLGHAKVFYSVLGGSRDPALTQEILDSAADFLRGPLGRALGLRHSPQLRFELDVLIEQGAHLSGLISKAVREDAKRRDATDQGDASSGSDPDPDETGEADDPRSSGPGRS